MNREVLERPFDSTLIKTRQGAFGKELSYVEARHYIERLNESFDGIWSFEVVEHEVRQDEVLVLGKLTAEGVTKMAFGGSAITRNRKTNEPVSGADDLKSAATDSLKKAASLLGVGLHLYGDDSPQEPTYQVSKVQDGSNGANNGSRLTSRQLAAIWALTRQQDIPQRDVRARCMERWGRQPEFLTRAEASTLIERLKARS